MRIPGFILEHPVEGLIAGALLLALVFGSADRHAATVDQGRVIHQLAAAQKM
jgi:hypothetical protein